MVHLGPSRSCNVLIGRPELASADRGAIATFGMEVPIAMEAACSTSGVLEAPLA